MNDEQMITKTGEKTSNRQRVLEAIHGLHNLGVKYIKTANITGQTGMSRQQVADAIKDLRDRGDIVSPSEGVYEPVMSCPPSQALTVTVLPDGTRKIEKGDEVLTVTAPEWTYQLAPLVAGSAAQAQVAEHIEQTLHLMAVIQQMRRQIDGLKSLVGENPRQIALIGE